MTRSHVLWSLTKRTARLTIMVLGVSVLQWASLFLCFPGAGGEFHAIFSNSVGGDAARAIGVYVDLVVISCLISSILVFLRYPLHWLIIALAVSALTWWRWWNICTFAYRSQAFYEITFPLGFLLPFPILTMAQAAAFLRRRCHHD